MEKRQTLMLNQPADLLPALQIPYLDNLIRAAGREPFAAVRGRGEGFDGGDVRGEYEYRG